MLRADSSIARTQRCPACASFHAVDRFATGVDGTNHVAAECIDCRHRWSPPVLSA